MLDLDTRTAILRLRREGHGLRAIARALGIARNSVKAVVESGSAVVPVPDRPERAEPHETLILELHIACKGNLVRVHEELARRGVTLAYPTLTAFCRRHEIGTTPKTRSGTYTFEPGEEMQHDTSPHRVTIGGKEQLVQCASLVLCFSRMRFVQMYPVFNRFTCKVFLTDAFEYLSGAAARCMIDNTHVILAGGSGNTAIIAPEMLAFSERFDFHFTAHAVGDANRSARVERRFHHIEHNFYPGRTFEDFADLNAQAIAWCDQTNSARMRHINAVPLHLFQTERVHLKPLPVHVPEVYLDHLRGGDLEGYVRLHTNRYSVPDACIGRELRVRETKDRIRIFDGHALVADHAREPDRAGRRRTLPEHEHRAKKRGPDKPPIPEEGALRAAGGPLPTLVDTLRKLHGGRAVRPLRQLHRLFLDYPKEPLVAAIEEALRYGLCDLARIERMTLRRVAGDYFRLPPPEPGPHDDGPLTENDSDG
jgi:transposase